MRNITRNPIHNTVYIYIYIYTWFFTDRDKLEIDHYSSRPYIINVLTCTIFHTHTETVVWQFTSLFSHGGGDLRKKCPVINDGPATFLCQPLQFECDFVATRKRVTLVYSKAWDEINTLNNGTGRVNTIHTYIYICIT